VRAAAGDPVPALLASGPAIAERWYVLSSERFDARITFDLDALAPFCAPYGVGRLNPAMPRARPRVDRTIA